MCANRAKRERTINARTEYQGSLVNIRVPGDRRILIDTFELKYIDDHVLRPSGICSHFVDHQAVIIEHVG